MREHRLRAVAVASSSGVLFGTTGTAVVLADTGASSLSVGAARLGIGAIGLVAVSMAQRGPAAVFALWRTPVTWLMAIGVAAYMALFFSAVHAGGVAIASLVSISLGPFFAATFARLWARPWPGATWLASTVLAISGVVLLGWPTGGADGGHRVLGALLAAGASASYALFMVCGSQIVAGGHHSTDSLAASFSLGALLMLPLLIADAGWLMTWRGAALALWLGIATTTCSYVMLGYGFTHLAPSVVTTLVLTEPMVATLLSVFVLQQVMPLRGWVGCAVIIVGLLLVGRGETTAARADARRQIAAS